jgi:hypothetical protein
MHIRPTPVDSRGREENPALGKHWSSVDDIAPPKPRSLTLKELAMFIIQYLKVGKLTTINDI